MKSYRKGENDSSHTPLDHGGNGRVSGHDLEKCAETPKHRVVKSHNPHNGSGGSHRLLSSKDKKLHTDGGEGGVP
jgi:hypothetical protein